MLPKPDTCLGCPLFGCGQGFVPADGSGRNGVLIILEAAGGDEEVAGQPCVGKAGYYLFTQLGKVGLERDDFRIHNVLSCRPPENRLANQPFEAAAIAHCAPNLDRTIADHRIQCDRLGKHQTILALGRIALKRVLDLKEGDPLLKEDYHGYVHRSARYDCWVLSADHPAFLMRGQHQLVPVLQYSAQRAVEVASDGFRYHEPHYACDPSPAYFRAWVDTYRDALERSAASTFLSFDIETPMKAKKGEDALVREDDEDYIILRCAFAFREGEAVSVPWTAEYTPIIESLFADPRAQYVTWNGCPTPDQRVLTADLRWIPAGDLQIGDNIVSLDEHVHIGRRNRRFKLGTVTSNNRYRRQVYEIVLSDGTSVKTTGSHPWLAKQRSSNEHKWQWITTEHLTVGQTLQRLLSCWDTDTTRTGGYLAGVYDGEGSLSQQKRTGTSIVGFAQKEGVVLDEVLIAMKERGFDVRAYFPQREKDADCARVQIAGNTADHARFLGTIRPKRLLSKWTPDMLGAVWSWKSNEVQIRAIKDLGMQEIVTLSVDEGTYVLEGFGAHNSYDIPRVRHQMTVSGSNHDGMLAWHVLNSALDKRLGFVAPFYAKDARMWKHLSGSQPAAYNAQDADMALRIYLGVRRDLISQNQMGTFDRHVIQLNRVLDGMSAAGLKRDEVMRADAEVRLTGMLEAIEANIQQAVPSEARRLKVYKGKPKLMEGVRSREVEVLRMVCPWCKKVKPPKSHFKLPARRLVKVKAGYELKMGEEWGEDGTKVLRPSRSQNVCGGLEAQEERVVVTEYFKEVEWKPSTVQLSAYQRSLAQQAVKNRDGRVTFDDNAIKALQRKYPKDELYKHLLEFRRVQKLRGTYVGITQPDGRIKGGLILDRRGLISCEYTHNPSTLRLACQAPNLTNLPRVGDEHQLESIIRNLVVARDGMIFIERDFSAIESVLTAYFARWRDGIRLAKIGVHAYLASHVLGRPADLSWSDVDIRQYLKAIKKSDHVDVQRVYNACKRCVHGSNYGMTPRKMVQSEPQTFPDEKYATRIQDIYFEVAAPIRKWHLQTQLEAHQNGYLRNPFGYILRLTHVFRNVKENGKWVRKPGDQANEALAFLPQSTAAGIIKEAMLRLWEIPETRAAMRLMVHDSLLLEVLQQDVELVDAILKAEMEKPVPELVLPDSYGLGSYLNIDTDGKRGTRWGGLH